MFIDLVEKSTLNGLTTALVGIGIHGRAASVVLPIVNKSVPLYALTFIGGFLGNLAGDAVHDTISNNLPIDRKVEDTASLLIGSLVNGFTFYGLLHMSNPLVAQDYGMIPALLTGAGGELVSSYSYNYIKNVL